jgi:nitric oxide dioxygenase
MIDQESIRIVQATAPAVAANAEAITRSFYERMFTGNPEVKAYFNPAHQHAGTQQRALAAAICAYAANIDNLGVLGPAVDLIAHKHCSLGIQPEHYPIVGKHLLLAVKDILPDAATDEVIAAWAEAYGLLANICIEREADIYRQQAAAVGGWNGYRPLVVTAKVPESEIITSFYLSSADDRPLPQFLPGQYITVKIDDAKLPSTPRNYSLSDRPGLPHYRISVKREPSIQKGAPDGLVSNYLHQYVREGDTLNVGPPCGNFTLDVAKRGDRPIVLLAGGIGITPILSMLKALAASSNPRPVHFVHAARNSRVSAFSAEIRRSISDCPNIQTHYRFDTPLADDLETGRCNSVGLIDLDFLQRLLPTSDADFFFCGPQPFMAVILRALQQWGVPEDQLHYEFFGPKQELEAGPQRRVA